VYNNRVFTKISAFKREEATGCWRKLHRPNKEVHNLYSSPNIIKVTKSRRWVRHIARMRDDKCIQHFEINASKKETSRKTQVRGYYNES
jgi:hypothetical protein